MDAIATALRAARGASEKKKKDRTPEEKDKAIAMYAYRAANNLDLWTGEPRPTYGKVNEPEVVLAGMDE